MKRVLVVFTGGTIGSQSSEGTIHVKQAAAYPLIEQFKQQTGNEDIHFDTLQPLNLLSENITPEDWRTLAAAIRKADLSVYEGIVVTHGSDTLAYSAALLGFLFADLSIPLVLTASNYPLNDPRSNGSRNFHNAVHFILDGRLPGVFVVYENDKEQMLVYLATRLTQAISFTDQYGTPYGIHYGEMIERRFTPFAHERNPLPERLSIRESVAPSLSWEPQTLQISDEIVYIKPYPGLNYSFYSFGEDEMAAGHKKPRAVLHDLHHSGTASAVEEGPYSLPQFIARCSAAGIPTYISPVRDASAALYSSTRKLIEAGAIVIEGMSADAALMKLMLGLGHCRSQEELKRFVIETELYYEFNRRYDQ